MSVWLFHVASNFMFSEIEEIVGDGNNLEKE